MMPERWEHSDCEGWHQLADFGGIEHSLWHGTVDRLDAYPLPY
jgi:hypothetical protein